MHIRSLTSPVCAASFPSLEKSNRRVLWGFYTTEGMIDCKCKRGFSEADLGWPKHKMDQMHKTKEKHWIASGDVEMQMVLWSQETSCKYIFSLGCEFLGVPSILIFGNLLSYCSIWSYFFMKSLHERLEIASTKAWEEALFPLTEPVGPLIKMLKILYNQKWCKSKKQLLRNATLLAKQINVDERKIGYLKCLKGLLHPLLKSAVNQISLVHAFKYQAKISKI